MGKKYIKHIVEDGSRTHVCNWVKLKNGKVFKRCSEFDCEINEEWDNYYNKNLK